MGLKVDERPPSGSSSPSGPSGTPPPVPEGGGTPGASSPSTSSGGNWLEDPSAFFGSSPATTGPSASPSADSQKVSPGNTANSNFQGQLQTQLVKEAFKSLTQSDKETSDSEKGGRREEGRTDGSLKKNTESLSISEERPPPTDLPGSPPLSGKAKIIYGGLPTEAHVSPKESSHPGDSSKAPMAQGEEIPPPPRDPSSSKKGETPLYGGISSLNRFQSFPGTAKSLTLAGPAPSLVEKSGVAAKTLKGYGPGQLLYDSLFGMKKTDDLCAPRGEIRKMEHELRVKMRIIMLMILMGDVAGAMRFLLFEAERQNRMFDRLLLKQLNRVREAKSKVLLALGRKPPPKIHDPNDPKDKDAMARYNQWTTVTSQLMSEIGQGEREIMDFIGEARRQIQEMWEAYSGIKEAEARTARTVYQSFRS